VAELVGAEGDTSGCLSFRLRPERAGNYIPVALHVRPDEWRKEWCFVQISSEDDPALFAEPAAAPEAPPSWSDVPAVSGLEAVISRIQHLRDCRLEGHHVVNYFVRERLAPLQFHTRPFWELGDREGKTRLTSRVFLKEFILEVSNSLVVGNQVGVLRPLRAKPLDRQSKEERRVVLTFVPHCDEWGLAAPTVATAFQIKAPAPETSGEGEATPAHLPRHDPGLPNEAARPYLGPVLSNPAAPSTSHATPNADSFFSLIG
jgi:hypothetical protein